MRKMLITAGLILTSFAALQASTLLQLTLNDMIQQSTSIVRGKAQVSYVSQKGSVVYTHYKIQVSSTFKGAPVADLDLAMMGGVNNGVRQMFAGAPELVNGQEYVLFLWTSKSGLTQIIGLSQGLFKVMPGSSGQLMMTRSAATELMLNGSGQVVTDSDFQMPLGTLQTRIQSVLSGASR